MSLATDLTAREAEVIRVMKLLAVHKDKFVVIGGYAVNAITSHRFSVDCDLVVARKNLGVLERILTRQAYIRQRPRKLEHIHGVRTEKFTKLVGNRGVSVDLFIDQIVCRQTEGNWTYEQIKRNSFESDVVGLTGSARAFVPKRELLIAMKAHTGRDADLRDMVMLSEQANWKLVSEFAETGVKEKVIRQIAKAVETINTNQFTSALKAEFALSVDVTPLIKKSVEGLNIVRQLLSS